MPLKSPSPRGTRHAILALQCLQASIHPSDPAGMPCLRAALGAFGSQCIEGDDVRAILAPDRIMRALFKIAPACTLARAHAADALQISKDLRLGASNLGPIEVERRQPV